MRVPLDRNVRTKSGVAQEGVQLYVYLRGSTTQVTGYTTETGATAVTYPLTSDIEGRFPNAWYPAGFYDLYWPADTLNPTEPWDAGGAAPITAVKTADETVSNSNTPQADNELLFPIRVNETWFAEAYLRLTGASTTADWLFGWSGPTGATAAWGPLSSAAQGTGGTFLQTAVGNSPGATVAIGSTVSHGGISGTQHLAIAGWFFADATNAGNITFLWSQNTATVENNTVKANSFLRLTRLV